MKVAVLFSGHLRTYAQTLPNWHDHIFSKYDTDIYFATWDVLGHRTDGIGDTVGQAKRQVHEIFTGAIDSLPVSEDIGLELMELCRQSIVVHIFNSRLHSQRFEAESQKAYTFVSGTIAEPRISHAWSMWWLTSQAWQMMANPDEYDVILKGRPDMVFTAPPNITEESKKLKLPWYSTIPKGIEPHDCFAAGPPYEMQKYCKLYQNLDSIVNRAMQTNAPDDIHNLHILCYRNLMLENINYLQYPYTLSIIR